MTHFGEHIHKAVHGAIDAEVIGVMTRRRPPTQGRGERICQIIERGSQPGDVVDPDRWKARGLVLSQATGGGKRLA